LAFFQKLPPCLVGIEACASAHHWSRELQALGHTAKLMPPAYVKPYVKRHKNDAAEASWIVVVLPLIDSRQMTLPLASQVVVVLPFVIARPVVRPLLLRNVVWSLPRLAQVQEPGRADGAAGGEGGLGQGATLARAAPRSMNVLIY